MPWGAARHFLEQMPVLVAEERLGRVLELAVAPRLDPETAGEIRRELSLAAQGIRVGRPEEPKTNGAPDADRLAEMGIRVVIVPKAANG